MHCYNVALFVYISVGQRVKQVSMIGNQQTAKTKTNKSSPFFHTIIEKCKFGGKLVHWRRFDKTKEQRLAASLFRRFSRDQYRRYEQPFIRSTADTWKNLLLDFADGQNGSQKQLAFLDSRKHRKHPLKIGIRELN